MTHNALRTVSTTFLFFLAIAMTSCGSNDATVVAARDGWILSLADEFDGAEGTPPDPTLWTHDVGGNGWGNNQLEFDTNRVENVAQDGAGHLRIVARKEPYMGRDYTSGRIKTKGLFQQRYGRFEARIQLPPGQGIWPAFWMLGADIDQVGWPECGEIDIMEFRGQDTRTVHGTIHGPGYSGADPIGTSYQLPVGESFTTDFHVFSVEWEPGLIRWAVDDDVYQTLTTSDVTARGRWAYDAPFFVLLNVAVGGNFVGPVGSNTVFPAEMLVDYVRVYERER